MNVKWYGEKKGKKITKTNERKRVNKNMNNATKNNTMKLSLFYIFLSYFNKVTYFTYY